MNRQKTRVTVRWMLGFYDTIIYLFVALSLFVLYPSSIGEITAIQTVAVIIAGYICIFGARYLANVYRQIWRFGSVQAYLRLIVADSIGGVIFCLLRYTPVVFQITIPRAVALIAVNLQIAVTARVLYQYLYQCPHDTVLIRGVYRLLNFLCATDLKVNKRTDNPNKIRIAIIGAGHVGVMLCEELLHNIHGTYIPVCFVDLRGGKVGREIYSLPVFNEVEENLQAELCDLGVQEVIIAIPDMKPEEKKQLYDLYKGYGFKVKAYDYPSMQEVGRRQLREYDIEELLFRTPKDFLTDQTKSYYTGKVVLITGGGGSIGSEMCRQIARMQPKQLIILDVYENGAYDIQQELRIKYGNAFDMRVEISTICDPKQLDQIIGYFRPDIVIHAAAHKHVPLMQRNAIEAVKNNIFGTLNLLELCEKYSVSRFMMVSTDKAVNPTNVMGATKRFCEMMVLNWQGQMIVSATRFGNVLGSAGSVIPLFRKQIKAGGPVTVTDKRIIRYFMTIPEASQLVLTSGAMAQNRELYVLDMGRPVRILELAENMIRMSGLEPYKDIEIIETGLRPGEKLYEELLIKGESLRKTENEMIFIEKEEPIDYSIIREKLEKLSKAVDSLSAKEVRETLYVVVPTYCAPELVNAKASEAEEMKASKQI